MGVSNSKSKAETCEPLRLCKERKRFMKQAIDSRYNLAAAHVVYVQSLHNIGIALGKLAETEVSLESSSSSSSSSHSSPAQIGCNNAAGGGGGDGGTDSANNSRLDYMKSGGVSAVTVNLNPSMISNSNKVYVVDDVESSPLTMSPPPQPPPMPPRFSWDYFDPTDGSFRLMGHDRFQSNPKDANVDTCSGGFVTPPEPVKKDQNGHLDDGLVDSEVNGSDSICENGHIEQCDLEDGCLTEETEDPAEFISHRAKDFVSSIKDAADYFVRASKSGKEVSRMLEANQIQISYSESNGGSPRSSSSFLTCFRGENTLVLHEPPQTTEVITWKRSMSSNPSLLQLPAPQSTDDNDNYIHEFGMIAGSHSSTLDRLYAWERKLYDEVKASESIRKEYVRKCDELRHQFAKDLKPHLIDKTRAVVKDLHSRMKVALHTVDSISRRIEKMRDEELQPQLMELIQGLMRMWKSMLECHHAQCIAMSSANHSRTRTRHNETKNQTIMNELEHEVECFGSSFSNLVKSYTSYVESINNWLQNCIIQPKERVKGRRVFSPRRAVAPPIFVMCRDWSAGIRSLPFQNLSDVIKEFLYQIRRLSIEEEMKNKDSGLTENGEEKKMDDDVKVRGLDLSMIHGSLTKVFDRLTRYCEESLKMYEEIKEKSESAGNLYSNYRPPARPSIT